MNYPEWFKLNDTVEVTKDIFRRSDGRVVLSQHQRGKVCTLFEHGDQQKIDLELSPGLIVSNIECRPGVPLQLVARQST